MRTRSGFAPVTRVCGAIHRTGRICQLNPDRPHPMHITEVPVVIDPSGIVEWPNVEDEDPAPASEAPDVCLAFVERRRARLG